MVGLPKQSARALRYSFNVYIKTSRVVASDNMQVCPSYFPSSRVKHTSTWYLTKTLAGPCSILINTTLETEVAPPNQCFIHKKHP